MDLVPDLRKLAVGAQLGGGEGKQLLLRHPHHVLYALAIGDLEQVVAHDLEPAGLPPDLGWVQGGQNHFLATDPVHLLADDGLDLEPRALAEREHRVVAGGDTTDESAPHQEPMADGFGVGGLLAEGGYESF